MTDALDPHRLDVAATGERLHRLMAELYPICRSITGEGVRRTLRRLASEAPLEIREVPSGTRVFDWEVPPEWNVRGAWIKGPDGQKVVDFADSNLHLVSYSVPIHAKMDRAELDAHLHSLPERPDAIPYRTSYYTENWGFCLPHRLREGLPEGEYEVLVDSTLGPGSLTYAEALVPGRREEEVLISTHVCHPSMCNDNLSGVVVATELARLLGSVTPEYSYRFVFLPGTIGSITWLARNAAAVSRIRHGLVAAGLGGPGGFHYKRSRRGDAEIDRAVARVLEDSGEAWESQDFVPFGYDERQYCSPGFDLPVGSLTRTPYGRYPEYHTSDDNLAFVRPRQLGEAVRRYLEVFRVLETNRRYVNTNPHCEPQLGRRGLYRGIGGGEEGRDRELALLWVLNLADGDHRLLDIAERSGMRYEALLEAARALLDVGLLREEG